MTRTTASRKIDKRPPAPPLAALTFDDRQMAARLSDLLLGGSGERGRVSLTRADGRAVDLSPSFVDVLETVAQLVAGGASVTVMPSDEALTTQAAADTLNVSRQYLVRLIDRGVLPAHKVGAHRRVLAKDVAAYRQRRDAARRAGLDALAADAQEAGAYAAPMAFGPRRG